MQTKLLVLLAILAVVGSQAKSTKVDVTYGVQKEYLSFYTSALAGGKFTCVDKSATIDVSLVNDGYCDCLDGTDEPGTAACSYQVNFPDKWRFQCKTPIGDRHKELFHSRINDRICDCCDGSDEYEGLVECPNNCAAAAEKEEREARERETRRQNGLREKEKLEKEGNAKKSEIALELAKIEAELQQVSKEVAPLEEVKRVEEEKETQEREAIKMKSLEEKVKWEAEEAKRKEEAEKADAERRAAAEAHPEIPRTSDGESVRYVCSKWRQTKECKGDGERDQYADRECEDLIESGWSGYCECFDATQGVEVTHRFDCGHLKLKCSHVCAYNGEVGTGVPEMPAGSGAEDTPEAPTFKVDDGSSHQRPEANEARAKFNEVNSKKVELERRKKELEEAENAQFFEYPAFLALKGQCFSKDDGSYSYHLCLYDKVSQGSRGQAGHYGTSMGEWRGFGEQTYSAWGAKHDISKMKFEHGQHCYGGPARSTEVSVVCGPENKILSINEPSMCTYTMVFQTPAVCE